MLSIRSHQKVYWTICPYKSCYFQPSSFPHSIPPPGMSFLTFFAWLLPTHPFRLRSGVPESRKPSLMHLLTLPFSITHTHTHTGVLEAVAMSLLELILHISSQLFILWLHAESHGSSTYTTEIGTQIGAFLSREWLINICTSTHTHPA